MTRDTTPAPAPLFEPTVADLLQAIEALKDQLADADREKRCLQQRVHDLETEIANLRARAGA